MENVDYKNFSPIEETYEERVHNEIGHLNINNIRGNCEKDSLIKRKKQNIYEVRGYYNGTYEGIKIDKEGIKGKAKSYVNTHIVSCLFIKIKRKAPKITKDKIDYRYFKNGKEVLSKTFYK